MTIDIIGAGLAGLLASNMLTRHEPIVYEAQPALPNNHSAVLRFRTSLVGDVLGIGFRKVSMIKTSVDWKNPVADALAYSKKNTGKSRSDRSIIAGLTTADRYVAPNDLIERMASRQNIKFKEPYAFAPGMEIGKRISTIPMPVLMKCLDYPNQPKFEYVAGTNIRAIVADCDAYVSLLVPNPIYAFSRISITGDEIIIELPGAIPEHTANQVLAQASDMLGVPYSSLTNIKAYSSQYAKILPIDDVARKDFIYWATDRYGIFALGRFATWRPNLLLDDLVNDIRLIDGWLSRADRYAVSRHRRT